MCKCLECSLMVNELFTKSTEPSSSRNFWPRYAAQTAWWWRFIRMEIGSGNWFSIAGKFPGEYVGDGSRVSVCVLFKVLCYGGVNAATVHSGISRWNGMRHREGVCQFQNVKLYRWHSWGDHILLDMKCIFQNIRSPPIPSWQNVPKWQKKLTEDMEWMEMIVAPLLLLLKRSALETLTAKGAASNSLKVMCW